MSVEALYIHLPFCRRRCRYCDFESNVAKYGDIRAYAYASKLETFLASLRQVGILGGLKTAYLGGGTPTMLGAQLLSELLYTVTHSEHLQELSFEANPDSLDKDVLRATKKAGATRISIGVQSFVDLELEALGRIHSAETAKRAVSWAIAAGFDTSLDLMCGIPYQNLESWCYSLDQAVSLNPDHISVYPLTIEEGTMMEQLCESGELPWPDDDAQADYMEFAEARLCQAGMARYEVASYAKRHKACKHNIAYWTGQEYLGLGSSAASMLRKSTYKQLRALLPSLPELSSDTSRVRFTCTSSLNELIATEAFDDLSFDIEQLSEREAVAEDLMLAVRMTRGIDGALLDRAYDVIGKTTLMQTLEDLCSRGLLQYNNECWQPTHAGWLLGNQLYGALWGLAEE